ncbi:MAG TPA: DUF6515 family protein [Casimicrobiaceae bacterium]|jgi:hypothetical protein
MKSTVKLAFSAIMLGASVFWGAEHVALAQHADASDTNLPAYEPSPLVQITAPRDAADSGVPEVESRDQSDDPSLRGSLPPLSPEAVDVISNGRRYWYDNALWYVEDGSGLSAAQPPVGIVISKLPPMYATGFYDDGTPYYYAHGVYYVPVDGGYAVTDAPTL